MKPPDEVRRELVQEWLHKAEEDFSVADYLVSGKTPFLTAVGFHTQQAIEKFLKAFLVHHQVEFTKTHNLNKILDLVATIDVPLAESLRDVAVLTPYGVDVRYPGDVPEMTPEGAKKAVELASKTRDAIRHALEV